MKFNTELNKDSLREFYLENKKFMVPAAAIAISFALFIFFILPQILAFPQNKQEADLENEKLTRIEQALEAARNANPQNIDSQLTVASATLPQVKNFESVLGTIESAASLSNTLILSYVFQDTQTPDQENTSKGTPSLNFKIEILGDPQEATFFIDELYVSNPISDVIGVNTSDGVSELDVLFYYKPLETISAEQKIEIKLLSADQNNIFNQISDWKNPSVPLTIDFDFTSTPSGSSSPF